MATKPLDVIPAVGPLDTRSPADLVPFGHYRFIRNYEVDTKNKLCREPGFDKLLTGPNYNNEDLHDQLQDKTGFASRLPITMLFQAESTRKTTKLIAGTARAIYALNNGTGNWKVLADKFGSSNNSRWRTPAQLLDTVVFTNNEDPLLYWQFDQGITETDSQSVAQIPDLRDEIKISKVGVVIAWKDHLFLMNVVVDGTVRSNSIFWCNYQKPLDWLPSEGSTAGSADIDYGETILGALPMQGRLLVYTNKGIWEINAVGGEQVFTLNKRYAPASFERCLFYPRTLVSDGDTHYFMGVDAVYSYTLFQTLPQQVAWIHNASGWMFKNLRSDSCDLHVGGYQTRGKRVLFSFAKEGESSPQETLILTPEHEFAEYQDIGYSAMVNYVFKEPVEIIRNFLLEQCICSEADFNTYWGGLGKEGGFCRTQPTISCPNPPTSIWTVTPTTPEDGITHEDWSQASSDSDSLCAKLGNMTLSQLCESELRQDECSSGLRFVVAHSVDFTLKEFSQNYYREITTGFTGCGTYERQGYQSLQRSGPLAFGDRRNDKLVDRFESEINAQLQSVPSKIKLRIGVHSQAIDPNEDNCGIVWDDQPAKELDCKTERNAAQHKANNTIPDDTYGWPLYNEGKFIYFETIVLNDKVTPKDTGGPMCVSRHTVDAKLKKRSYV